MSGTRAHTDAEKARAVGLALVNGTKAAADATGVSQRSIQRWVDDPAMAELVASNKETVRGHFWAGMQVALDSVIEGLKQPEAPLQARANTMGILFDKWALMSGEATSRTESKDITHDLNDHEAEIFGEVVRAELARRADEHAAELAVESAASTGAEAPAG